MVGRLFEGELVAGHFLGDAHETHVVPKSNPRKRTTPEAMMMFLRDTALRE